MSIFKPTMAITRFNVSGAPEADGLNHIDFMLEKFKAGQIMDMEMGEEMKWGWTKLLDPYCPHFDDLSFLVGNYVTIGLRIDKKSVPGAVLKKEVYLAEKKMCEEKQIPKLARAVKVLIKESVFKTLLEKAPAIPSMYDIIWDIDRKVLYLFSTNKLAREVVEDVIKESFDLDLQMVFPFTMGLSSVDEDILAQAQPTLFT